MGSGGGGGSWPMLSSAYLLLLTRTTQAMFLQTGPPCFRPGKIEIPLDQASEKKMVDENCAIRTLRTLF